MAKLEFWHGLMNQGKSEALINTANQHILAGFSVMTVMPEDMARKKGFITSRTDKEIPVDIVTDDETDLYREFQGKVGEKSINLACVLIDEASFLSVPQIEDLEKITQVDDINVVAFGLLTNVQRHMFEGAKRLCEIADEVHELPAPAICRCGNKARFNGRFVNDIFHVGEPIKWIDNSQSPAVYQSMCTACYVKNYNAPNTITN